MIERHNAAIAENHMTIRPTVTAGRPRRGELTYRVAVAMAVLGALLTTAAPSYAQHGNYLLGTTGLLGGSQPPEGIYYQNIFSYYNASGPLLSASRSRELEGPLGRPIGSVSANLRLDASLNAYVDQNIIGMTTPFKVLGANYGLFADIPFAEVHGT